MEYMTHHELLSAAVISTCPGYTEPRVFMVSETKSAQDIVIEMLKYMNEIAICVYRYKTTFVCLLAILI